MKYQELTGQIIQCAYAVHNTLGFGFLEAVYQNALLIELEKNSLKAVKETPIKVSYNGQIVGDYVADILVEDKIILELKSVKELHPVHEAQLTNYLKATGLEVGLLINFGESVEIKRKVFTPPQADETSQEIGYPVSEVSVPKMPFNMALPFSIFLATDYTDYTDFYRDRPDRLYKIKYDKISIKKQGGVLNDDTNL